MKAIQFSHFGIKNLKPVEIPQPEPKHNEVLVKVTAASLQHLDLIVVNGSLNPNLPLPHIPVSEGAGVIEKVGDGVTIWTKGDRVLIPFIQKWEAGKINTDNNSIRTGIQTPGLLSEYLIAPANTLVRTPNNLSDEEAASLPVSGLTAWANLVTQAKIQAGQTVLIQGSGSVSLFALQIARLFGVKIIATTGSEEKIKGLKALGAHEVINYKKHREFSKEVKRLNNGQGVDITLDIAGQATIEQSILSCKENAYVGLVGFLSGGEITIKLSDVIMNYIRLQGNSVGSSQDLIALVNAIEINNLKPVIDKIYPIEQIQQAFTYLEAGKAFGKVVVKM
jgi:NADPH:quinone reductase-like Zn-dependent oxidoreductase